MSLKRILFTFILLVSLLSACAPQPTAAPVAVEPTTAAPAEVAETALPEPTAEPTTPPAPAEMILATTTSTQDSGLLDYLLPDFEKEFNVKINVVAVGSGQAIQMGADGNADVLLVHSPAAEKTFMEEKQGTRREDVMFNDFVIIGPEADPAGIKGLATAVEAFTKISEEKAVFVSRGDDSGTHNKEKAVWKSASIEPTGDWYISAGQGMGAVLTMSEEKAAYTLSDRATYLTQTQKGLTLKVMVEGDKQLLNPYGVIAVDPSKSPKINAELANKFIDWLISVPVQQKISDFNKDVFGMSIFTPSSAPWKEMEAAKPAAFSITGKVTTEIALKLEDLQAMDVISSEQPGKDNSVIPVEGIPLSKLLELASPAADAKTVVFVADDGYSVEAAYDKISACDKCVIIIKSDGSLASALPGFEKNMQVKGLVKIEIK